MSRAEDSTVKKKGGIIALHASSTLNDRELFNAEKAIETLASGTMK